jgi:hypothetical protein
VTLRSLVTEAARAFALSVESLVSEAAADDVSLGDMGAVDWLSVDPHAIGQAYESRVPARQAGGRKLAGAYYTSPALARLLATQALSLGEAAGRQLPTILDPACGCGGLLIEALRVLCGQRNASVLDGAAALWGCDRDAGAVTLARLALIAASYQLGARGLELPAIARALAAHIVVRDCLLGDAPEPADCLLMNPPYVRAALAVEERETIRRLFPTAVGAFDLQVPFIEFALRSVREGGALGLLTSNKFLVADYGRALREVLAREATLIRLIDLADCADTRSGALVSQAVTIAVRRPPPVDHEVELHHPRALDEVAPGCATIIRRKQKDLLNTRWPLLRASAVEERLLAKMTLGKAVRLDSIALVRGGVRGFDYHLCCRDLCESAGEAGEMPVLCPGNVRAYRAPVGRVRLEGRQWLQPCLRARPERVGGRLWELFAQPKLVVKGVGARPTAAWVPGPAALLVAVWGVWAEEETLWRLLALLNSAPAAWLHYEQLYAARIPRGSLRVPLSWVAAFPVPTAGLDEAAEIAGAIHATSDPQQAAELQERIDRVVSEAYGLDEGERALMAKAPLRKVQW